MVNSTDVQTILDADLLCLIRKYRITKVRSRQRVKPVAVQPIVMWIASGNERKKNEKIFCIIDNDVCSFIILRSR